MARADGGGRHLARVVPLCLVASASAQAAEPGMTDGGTGWLLGMAAAAIVAAIVAAGSLGLLIRERHGNAAMRQQARAVERIMSILTDEPVCLADVPAHLEKVQANAEALLARLDAPVVAAPLPVAAAPGPGRAPLLIDASIAAVQAASAEAVAIPAASEPGPVAQFNIAAELDTAAQALRTARDSGNFEGALVNALRTGLLNHLLTMAALLDTYFRDDPQYRGLRASYRAAAGIVACLLTRAGVVLDEQPLLSFVPRGRLEVSMNDIRLLRKIRPVRDQVRVQARRQEEGELLIIDCMAPGWRIGKMEQAPNLIAYNRSEWVL